MTNIERPGTAVLWESYSTSEINDVHARKYTREIINLKKIHE